MGETVKPGQNVTGDFKFWVKFAGAQDDLFQAARGLGLDAELVPAGVEVAGWDLAGESSAFFRDHPDRVQRLVVISPAKIPLAPEQVMQTVLSLAHLQREWGLTRGLDLNKYELYDNMKVIKAALVGARERNTREKRVSKCSFLRWLKN